jgi:hypothetical protein
MYEEGKNGRKECKQAVYGPATQATRALTST